MTADPAPEWHKTRGLLVRGFGIRFGARVAIVVAIVVTGNVDLRPVDGLSLFLAKPNGDFGPFEVRESNQELHATRSFSSKVTGERAGDFAGDSFGGERLAHQGSLPLIVKHGGDDVAFIHGEPRDRDPR